jgi:hypothetical protein
VEKKEGRVKVPDTCAEAAAIFDAAAKRAWRTYDNQKYSTYAHALRLLGDTPLTANFVLEFDWEKFS